MKLARLVGFIIKILREVLDESFMANLYTQYYSLTWVEEWSELLAHASLLPCQDSKMESVRYPFS